MKNFLDYCIWLISFLLRIFDLIWLYWFILLKNDVIWKTVRVSNRKKKEDLLTNFIFIIVLDQITTREN